MYLPKHQFTSISVSDLLTQGGTQVATVLTTAAGKLFNKREIIITSEGELYDVPPSDLEKGIFTNATQYFIPTEEAQPLGNAFVEPTDKEKEACKFERYFTKNKSTGKIKELTKADYQGASLSPKNYESFAKTDWIVCGPLPDQVINGYFLEGTESKNRKLVDELEKQIPGIQDVLTDYGQFVTDTTPPAPAPAPKTKITIPAPSKRL
jgi:hypothetical protein